MMKVGRAAGTVSSSIFMSRIFGLVRDQIFAALIGAGFFADAYIVAFRIPNLLRDLFAEGALSSAFVPTFTEYEVKKGGKDAWALANLVIGVLLTIAGTLTLVGIIFAPSVVSVIAPGFETISGKTELTIVLARIMFPYLPIIAVAALFMGMLNVRGDFALPAFAPVLFNLVSIGFGLTLWFYGASGKTAVIGWSVGTLCGGLAQALIQVPRLRKLGWRFRPTLQKWKTEKGLRQIGRLMAPAVIGLSATQINILVNTILASLLEEGSPSWLTYSFRLMQLPIGVFGVGIGIVTLPLVSRDAVRNSPDSFRKTLTTSFSLVLLLTIPAAVGLWILGDPIVSLIFQRGAFLSADTTATAAALSFFAVGLPAYAAVKVLAPSFYALKDAKAPMMASILAVVVNLTFNLSTYKTLGFRGLALGTSFAATTNLLVLFVVYQFRHGGLPLGALFVRLLKIGVGVAGMAWVAVHSHQYLQNVTAGLPGRLLDTLGPIALAAGVYFVILLILRVPEMDLVRKMGKKIFQKIVPN